MITQPLKILVVEDQVTDAALIQRQIRKCVEEVEITITDNLLSFRHALKTFIPDFVFTDFQMVGFNGFEVMEQLHEIYPNIPVVVISGTLNDEELVARIINKGASAFLLKSNISDLHSRLEPIITEVLEKQQRLFMKLERQREEREKIERIHAILKTATKDEASHDEKTKEYYEKLISEISDNLPNVIK